MSEEARREWAANSSTGRNTISKDTAPPSSNTTGRRHRRRPRRPGNTGGKPSKGADQPSSTILINENQGQVQETLKRVASMEDLIDLSDDPPPVYAKTASESQPMKHPAEALLGKSTTPTESGKPSGKGGSKGRGSTVEHKKCAPRIQNKEGVLTNLPSSRTPNSTHQGRKTGNKESTPQRRQGKKQEVRAAYENIVRNGEVGTKEAEDFYRSINSLHQQKCSQYTRAQSLSSLLPPPRSFPRIC